MSYSIKKFNSRNVILFQIEVFGRNTKDTTLPKYFITRALVLGDWESLVNK